MKIAVLIKQVPNTTKVCLDPVTNNLIRDGIESILNPYDIYALELALQIKEKTDCVIEVFSMGPQPAADIIKYAYSMGADQGILLSDRAFAGSDTLATSYILSEAVKKEGMPDLIICGKQAIDGDTAQAPEEIAGHLGIFCLTNVCQICGVHEKHIEVVRQTDYARMKMRIAYPAVLTVEKGFSDPRLPKVKDMIRGKNMQVSVWDAKTLQADPERMSIQGSPTKVVRVFSPSVSRETRILQGSLTEQMEECLQVLSEREIVFGAKENKKCLE